MTGRIRKDIRDYYRGLLIVIGLYFLLHYFFDAFCPSVLVTGFPCPGCGMTRAVLYLLKGQAARSYALNPAASLWMLWALYFAWQRYVKGKRTKSVIWLAMGIIVFMLVSYVYRMHMFFPDRPPYVYTPDNLLAERLPGYQEVVRKILLNRKG